MFETCMSTVQHMPSLLRLVAQDASTSSWKAKLAMGVARVARRSLVVDPATGGSAAPHGGTAVATHSAKAKAKAVLFAWDPANKEDREAAAAKLQALMRGKMDRVKTRDMVIEATVPMSKAASRNSARLSSEDVAGAAAGAAAAKGAEPEEPWEHVESPATAAATGDATATGNPGGLAEPGEYYSQLGSLFDQILDPNGTGAVKSLRVLALVHAFEEGCNENEEPEESDAMRAFVDVLRRTIVGKTSTARAAFVGFPLPNAVYTPTQEATITSILSMVLSSREPTDGLVDTVNQYEEEATA